MARYRITIRFSSGHVEYRYSDRLPQVGDEVGRGDAAGVISSVKLDGDRSAFVTVRQNGHGEEVVSHTTTLYADVPPSPSTRDRILEAAYDLFSERGVRAVSMHDVIDRADVSRATLYRHYASKEELVLAFLALREQRWTREWVEEGARKWGASPEERLLAIFDVFDGWFRRPDFEGCTFINMLLEMNGDDPVHASSREYLANIRKIVRTLADEADLEDPEEFAHAWHVLMKGSIVAAQEGDAEAAQRTKSVARLLLDKHRRPSASGAVAEGAAPAPEAA